MTFSACVSNKYKPNDIVFEETLEQRPEESPEFQKIKCSVQAKTLEEFSDNFVYKFVKRLKNASLYVQ